MPIPSTSPAKCAAFSGNCARLPTCAALSAADYAAQAAHFLAELNAIHPFRDGNGRTQLAFMAILSDAAGHPLNIDALEPEPFLQAMIASFRGNEQPLQQQLRGMVAI